jgi:L-rhamnose mutarotase
MHSSTLPERRQECKAGPGQRRRRVEEESVQRICFLMKIQPGREDEYQRRHDEIWPELVAELQRAGVRNYTLFRRGTSVIAYAECHPDAATAFGAVGATEVNKRWAQWFTEVLAEHTDEHGNLIEATEVWHLD